MPRDRFQYVSASHWIKKKKKKYCLWATLNIYFERRVHLGEFTLIDPEDGLVARNTYWDLNISNISSFYFTIFNFIKYFSPRTYTILPEQKKKCLFETWRNPQWFLFMTHWFRFKMSQLCYSWWENVFQINFYLILKIINFKFFFLLLCVGKCWK